jgi:hypothetical protein
MFTIKNAAAMRQLATRKSFISESGLIPFKKVKAICMLYSNTHKNMYPTYRDLYERSCPHKPRISVLRKKKKLYLSWQTAIRFV